MLGYYLQKYDIDKKLVKLSYALGLFSILATILLTNYFSIEADISVDIFYSYLLPTTFFTSIAVFLFFKTHLSETNFLKKERN